MQNKISQQHSQRMPGLRNSGDDSEGLNPKDLIGASKIDLTLVSQVSIAHTAFAMMDGGYKYGEYNWRVVPVQARTYIAAAQRHLGDWLDGEEWAPDSMAHHLGHAIACCAILLDAMECGMLVDDRPIPGQMSLVLDNLTHRLKIKNAKINATLEKS